MSFEQRLVLVVGVGRSGTSLMAGILGQVGFLIPQPELNANDTNPRGFGEPAWAVNFHKGLLRGSNMTVLDARPAAWEATATAAGRPAVVARLQQWLATQLDESDAVVVKDPRIAWFLPLWTHVAEQLTARTSFVTMLRHPAAVLVSARSSYGTWQPDASRAAAWINVMLETERQTRGAGRVFVPYDELLADWAAEVGRIGRRLDLRELQGDLRARHPQVDEFVDPSLRRSRSSWEGLEVPPRLRDLAEHVWSRFEVLGRGDDGEDPAALAALDEARDAYRALYGESEAIAHSSTHAQRMARKRERARRIAQTPPPPPQPSPAAKLAKKYRRRLRRTARRLRMRWRVRRLRRG